YFNFMCIREAYIHPDLLRYLFFFFKQKTAYEITTGDWSSDVCSSDLQPGRAVDQPHAFSAPAGRGLHEDRVPDCLRALGDLPLVQALGAEPRDDGHAGRRHDPLRLDLAAHPADGVGRWADEDDARLRAGLREVRVLREEAVARVDRVRPGAPRHVEHPLDRQE